MVFKRSVFLRKDTSENVILQLKGKIQILKVGFISDLFLLQPGHSGWQCVGEGAGHEQN